MKYEAPICEVVRIDEDDIIRTSGDTKKMSIDPLDLEFN